MSGNTKPPSSKSDLDVRSPESWDKFYEENDPWCYTTSRYEKIKYQRQIDAVCGRLDPKAILEIGSSEGEHTSMLSNAFPEASITALDISFRATDRAAKRFKDNTRVSVVQGDLVDYISSAPTVYWDLIMWSESLHYFGATYSTSRLYRVIESVASTLNKGGLLCTANKVDTLEDSPRAVTHARPVVFEAYHVLFSGILEPIHRSRYTARRAESGSVHRYEIWLFMNRD